MDRDQQEPRRRRPPDTPSGDREPAPRRSRSAGKEPTPRRSRPAGKEPTPRRSRPADPEPMPRRSHPVGETGGKSREKPSVSRERPSGESGRKPREQGRTAPTGRRKASPPRKPAGRRQRKPQKAQARRTPAKPLPRRRLIAKLATMAAVVLALIVGVTIFFRVQKVQVSGNAKYTAQEILDASGIEMGENLLSIGKSRAAGKILAAFPYVDQVQIGIKLPNTVNIDIVEVEATYAIAADGGWWLMDAGGKLLEPVENPADYTQVTGISAEAPAPGGTLKAKESAETSEDDSEEMRGSAADRATAALEILKVLSEEDRTAQVTSVDVSELYNLQVWYGEKYQVILNGPTELTYKARYMVQAVEQLEKDGYRGGILDLTFTEPGKATFTPW